MPALRRKYAIDPLGSISDVHLAEWGHVSLEYASVAVENKILGIRITCDLSS